MKWVAGLGNGLCGLSDASYSGDWRLPTKTELMAMIISAKKQGFTDPVFTTYQGTSPWTKPEQVYDFQNVQSLPYWSSTTQSDYPDSAWIVDMGDGHPDYVSKSSYLFVWPVRGGQSGSFGNLRIE